MADLAKQKLEKKKLREKKEVKYSSQKMLGQKIKFKQFWMKGYEKGVEY